MSAELGESQELDCVELVKQSRSIKSLNSFCERTQPSCLVSKSVQDTKESASPLRIYIVRHAHSLSNQDPKLLQVCSDHTVPLSKKGKSQAEGCAKFLSNYFAKHKTAATKIAMFVSPYKRTRETAEIIEKGIQDQITKRHESIFLGEQQFGLFEGLPLAELSKKYPYEFTHFEKGMVHSTCSND